MSAVDSSLAYYYGGCATIDNFIASFKYNTGANHATGAAGSVTDLVSVATCTGSDVGRSFVFPANLQGTGFYSAQVGYGVVGLSTDLDWLYTQSDQNGTPVHPSGAHTKPILHHSYKMQVNYYAPDGKWLYAEHDNISGYTQSWEGSAGATYGDQMWTGFEVWNVNDQYGGAGAGAAASIHDPYVTYGGVNHYLASLTIYTVGTSQMYRHTGAAVQSNGHNEIWGYTDNR